MKAYKCDRCGLLFEDKVKYQKYSIANSITRNHYYDLCFDCSIGLEKWMDKFKDEENPCEDCYCNDGEVHTECGVICEEKKDEKIT